MLDSRLMPQAFEVTDHALIMKTMSGSWMISYTSIANPKELQCEPGFASQEEALKHIVKHPEIFGPLKKDAVVV